MKLRRIVALVLVLVAVVVSGPGPVMTPARRPRPGRRRVSQRRPAAAPRSSTSPSRTSRWWPASDAAGTRQAARPGDRRRSHVLRPLQRGGRHRHDPGQQSPRRCAARGRTSRRPAPTPALHGLLTLRGDRAEVEMRLYDLTSPDLRLIATQEVRACRWRRRAGWPTRSPTRSCCSSPASRASPTPRSPTSAARAAPRRSCMTDYDGAGPRR